MIITVALCPRTITEIALQSHNCSLLGILALLMRLQGHHIQKQLEIAACKLSRSFSKSSSSPFSINIACFMSKLLLLKSWSRSAGRRRGDRTIKDYNKSMDYNESMH